MVTPYIGEIRMFGGNFAPVGWLGCNGQLVSIADYSTLYALIGTTYGGDGVTTFGLPDLQGRIPLSQGQGVGLANYTIGEKSGTETVSLLQTQIPSHSHAYNVSPAKSSLTSLTGNLPGAVIGGLAGEFYANPTATPTPVKGALMPGSMGVGGGSQPHDNIMPSLCVTFIIATVGVYPQFG